MPTRAFAPAIAIVEWMQGHEPEMGDPGFQDRIGCCVLIEPVQEALHFALHPPRIRCLVMNFLLADGAANNLHPPDQPSLPVAGRRQ